MSTDNHAYVEFAVSWQLQQRINEAMRERGPRTINEEIHRLLCKHFGLDVADTPIPLEWQVGMISRPTWEACSGEWVFTITRNPKPSGDRDWFVLTIVEKETGTQLSQTPHATLPVAQAYADEWEGP
ncbi:MAG: hypothetical protein ACXIU5_05400 [Halomonadaceae bacterium]|jgi:hypothetical protein